MGDKILGFSYDYEESSRGKLLVVGEDEIPAEQLIEAGVKMLEAHEIPHVLPLNVEFTNLKAKLNYSLKGKRPLADILRGRKISIRDYVKILKQIIGAINESPRYFLNEANYVLETQYIYSSSDYGIGLVYLPLKQLTKKDTVYNEVKNNIVTVLYAQINDQDAVKGKAILEDFLSGEYSLLEIAESLEKYSSIQAATPIRPEPVRPIDRGTSVAEPVRPQKPIAPVPEKPKQPEKPKAAADRPKSLFNPEKKSISGKKDKPIQGSKVKKEASSKGKIFVIAGAVVVILLAWAAFLLLGKGSHKEGFLYIAIGLSVLSGDGVFAYIRLYKKEEAVPASESNKQVAAVRDPELKNLVMPQKPVQQASQPTQVRAASASGTAPLYNPTVALSEAYLEVEGSKDRINLSGLPIVIGRGKTYGNYVVTDSTVSNSHARIDRLDTQYMITDMGSTNHTKLNGTKLEPHQAYPLHEGDLILMGRSNFKFTSGI